MTYGAAPAVRRVWAFGLCLAGLSFSALLTACGPARPAATVAADHHQAAHGLGLGADDIPIAHTPPGGYGKSFPRPVLAACTEPLVKGAPDRRGIWKTLRAERGGRPAPAGDRIYGYVERIEQCGDRIIDMGGGTICDARADGTLKNGDHDVSVIDYKTPIHVIASYERGVFVLRPAPIPGLALTIPGLKVTRRLDAAGRMIWTRLDMSGLRVTLVRIGGPNDSYTRR